MSADLTFRDVNTRLAPSPARIEAASTRTIRIKALSEAHGIRARTNGAGSWCDNASVERLIATLRSEVIYYRRYRTCDEATADLLFCNEAFYNRRLRHSSLA